MHESDRFAVDTDIPMDEEVCVYELVIVHAQNGEIQEIFRLVGWREETVLLLHSELHVMREGNIAE